MAERSSHHKAKKANRWMQRAVPKSRRGVFTRKAERAGMSTQAYARKKEHAPGELGREARLALIFKREAGKRHHKKHESKRDHGRR